MDYSVDRFRTRRINLGYANFFARQSGDVFAAVAPTLHMRRPIDKRKGSGRLDRPAGCAPSESQDAAGGCPAVKPNVFNSRKEVIQCRAIWVRRWRTGAFRLSWSSLCGRPEVTGSQAIHGRNRTVQSRRAAPPGRLSFFALPAGSAERCRARDSPETTAATSRPGRAFCRKQSNVTRDRRHRRPSLKQGFQSHGLAHPS